MRYYARSAGFPKQNRFISGAGAAGGVACGAGGSDVSVEVEWERNLREPFREFLAEFQFGRDANGQGK